MRDSAHRNEVGATFRISPNRLQCDAPRKLHLGAPADFAHPFYSLGGCQIVEQQVAGAAIQSLAQLFPRAHFDLDREAARSRSKCARGKSWARLWIAAPATCCSTI